MTLQELQALFIDGSWGRVKLTCTYGCIYVGIGGVAVVCSAESDFVGRPLTSKVVQTTGPRASQLWWLIEGPLKSALNMHIRYCNTTL
jgi:hypothetical protein